MKNSQLILLATVLLFCALTAQAQSARHDFDKVDKSLEDVLMYEKIGDVAYISKLRLTGPAKANVKPTGNAFDDQFLGNDLVFRAYVFIPKTTQQNRKYPVVVFPHGGIHGTFATGYAPFVRELMAQGYLVIAPDYRGSTGYGKGFYQAIDYGGRENEDALACAKYMVNSYEIVDPKRVAIVGWSHGGMIALMNALQFPDTYACAFAGVPVSDVSYRLEYMDSSYSKEFSASYHIGKLPAEVPQEYARRSPVSYAKHLRIPLLINTTENDDDVSYKEVSRMIDSLKAYNKEFEYKIYPPMPGAHIFDRIDTPEAVDIRYQTHQFLARYLSPPTPFRSVKDMRRAAYYYY
ncbi:hypothetical protein AGMMS4956_06000 [Bacteroidia bacterium]|nr:hypothetical protein AGMMS4956_06000 [Bacteroidia bacterium]